MSDDVSDDVSESTHVCARCGNPCGYWGSRWKHQRGWHSTTPSCGLKPMPTTRAQYDRVNRRYAEKNFVKGIDTFG